MPYRNTPAIVHLLWILAIGLVTATGLVTTPALADAVKILPVDQAAQDPKFLEFRDNLLSAVRRRDVEAVVAVAAEDIKLSFGGGYGRDQFRQNLVADDNGEGGSYWAELEWALKLGGVFNGDPGDDRGRQFCTPYVSCTGSHQCGDCDPFETLVAVNDRAPVYATADSESAILTHLSYDVVTLIDYSSPRQRIRLEDGRIGYVAFPDFRSPIGYRAYFEKREGRWQMRIFIAGD